ncbi:vacuolar basic amino acid transporter 5 [Chaetomidium leptoderma]|uniref:Vacuolar basic amino acid transporter 5 n=1 Tax=Chaetomidium leptoderma TaxID=669021 RepID=A0AAN6ZY36_9PEZI|nr:vacuolar basic amino acid transporter 5 [Chaetomidium leptoderma]
MIRWTTVRSSTPSNAPPVAATVIEPEPGRDASLETTGMGSVEPPGDGAIDSQDSNGPDTSQQPARAAAALIMVPLCLSVAMSALDLTIVTPAIPAMVAAFQAESGYVWIGSAFILASTASTPVWGSVADIWGRKPIMLISVAIFMVGSLLCALARDIDALVAGRVVQGLGASGMGIMVNVIICDTFSLRDRGLYLAITSIVWAIASAVGPVVGGIFTTTLTWRWCFWINLPIGGLVFAVLLLYLKVPTPNTPILAGLKAIDWAGSVLIVGGALMVLLGLDFGGVTYPWSSATTTSLLVFGVFVVAIFLVVEWKFAANPVMPLRLFSTPSTAAAYAVFACNFYVFIGLAYYLPLYSQSVLAANALTSGVHLIPLIVACSLAAACTGAFIQRTGIYLPVMYVSHVMLALGTGLFMDLQVEASLTRLFAFEIIAGIGVGMNIEPPMLAAQAATPARDTAAVVATMGYLRSIANAVSIVVGGVIFQHQMDGAYPGLVALIGEQSASHFRGSKAVASLDFISGLPANHQGFVRLAYFDALKKMWIMYLAFAGLSLFLNLFVRSHHLSTEREDLVLGVNRGMTPAQEPVRTRDRVSVELVNRRRRSSHRSGEHPSI